MCRGRIIDEGGPEDRKQVTASLRVSRNKRDMLWHWKVWSWAKMGSPESPYVSSPQTPRLHHPSTRWSHTPAQHRCSLMSQRPQVECPSSNTRPNGEHWEKKRGTSSGMMPKKVSQSRGFSLELYVPCYSIWGHTLTPSVLQVLPCCPFEWAAHHSYLLEHARCHHLPSHLGSCRIGKCPAQNEVIVMFQ